MNRTAEPCCVMIKHWSDLWATRILTFYNVQLLPTNVSGLYVLVLCSNFFHCTIEMSMSVKIFKAVPVSARICPLDKHQKMAHFFKTSALVCLTRIGLGDGSSPSPIRAEVFKKYI